MTNKIKKAWGEKILDSRGNPTIKVTVEADGGSSSFSVPSGASTGTFEAHEIKDIDQVVRIIDQKINPQLVGQVITDQEGIDAILKKIDGTANKSNIGGNTFIGISIAVAKTAAKCLGQETYEYLKTLIEIKPSLKVPMLFMNLINGGKHARSKMPFQEFHVVPQVESAEEALEIGSSIFNKVRDHISKEMAPQFANVGDEGGATVDVGPTLESDDVFLPLDILTKSIDELGLKGKVKLAMDVAASSFYNENLYDIGQKLDKDQLYELYKKILSKYDVMSIEDPFQEEDFDSFAKMTAENPQLHIVGDDLTVTNVERLKKAIENKSINAIIIKPNQVGSLTETLQTMKMARENDIECIVSHRSGDTEDDFIADLAYAFGAWGLKSGAPNRGERIVKYNRLVHISKK